MFDFLDASQRELDLIQLTLLVFTPALVAILLFVIPSRWKEVMRWVALFGTGTTLTLALCTLVDYHRLLDSFSDRSVRSMYHPATRLDNRSDAQMTAAANNKPFRSDDLLTRRPWVSKFDVDYALGVDGISLLMVILTALVMFFSVIASWRIDTSVRGYLIMLLTLESGLIGAFLSLDLFLFYVFYEAILLPMYFLIGIWGGGERKYAAIKLVIYTLVGSVALLGAIIALHSVDVRDFVDQAIVKSEISEVKRRNPGINDEEAKKQAEVHTFDFTTLAKVGQAVMLIRTGQEDRLRVRGEVKRGVADTASHSDAVPLFSPGVDRELAVARLKSSSVCTDTFQYAIFLLLFFGFAVKVPLFPFHSWLPDAHVEAPTPVSMILAGVLLKLGGYGLIRFAYPICPWAAHELTWWVGFVGVFGIVYGALVAMGQSDFKKLLAYSSISHMGYVVLGLAAWSGGDRSNAWEWGVNGALFQMFSHGIVSAGLFFVVGGLYDRAHHRDLAKYGGLKEPMPLFSGMTAIIIFASLGLPGLCGFVGEFQVMLSAWAFSPSLAIPAILTTILTAGYLLWVWQRVFLGTNPDTAAYPESSARETSVLLPLAILCIVLGIIPGLAVFQWTEPSVAGWIDHLAKLK